MIFEENKNGIIHLSPCPEGLKKEIDKILKQDAEFDLYTLCVPKGTKVFKYENEKWCPRDAVHIVAGKPIEIEGEYK